MLKYCKTSLKTDLSLLKSCSSHTVDNDYYCDWSIETRDLLNAFQWITDVLFLMKKKVEETSIVFNR